MTPYRKTLSDGQGKQNSGPNRDSSQAWLDQFRWEHNHVRPHEALNMETPAQHWTPSVKRYDPKPPGWEYPEGSYVLKVDSEDKIKLQRQHYLISLALSGERVRLVTLEQRALVYYCRTLVRELDLSQHRSTIVDRCWLQDVP